MNETVPHGLDTGEKPFLGGFIPVQVVQVNLADSRQMCMQFRELEEDEARALEYTIEEDLKSFGKGFTVIEQVSHITE